MPELALTVAVCVTFFTLMPGLPAAIWTRRTRSSLRRSSRKALGLSNFQPKTLVSGRLRGAPASYVVLGFATPLIVGFALQQFGVASPYRLDRDQIGTLWQVQGALVGLALALALFGYEALGRTGPIEPIELAELHLPKAIYLGLSLVSLTGVAFFLLPALPITDTPSSPTSSVYWVSIGAVVVSAYWVTELLRALPDVIRVTDPRFRTRLRILQLRRMARVEVESRLVTLASRGILSEWSASAGAQFEPWLAGRRDPAAGRDLLSGRAGYLADVNIQRIQSVLNSASELRLSLSIGQRTEANQVLATCDAIPPSGMRAWNTALSIRDAETTDALDRLVRVLRDTAFADLGARPDAVSDVLDGFVDCLEAFAATWNRQAGRMDLNQLREPLRLDESPLGRISDAVADLMERAIKQEARSAIGELGYFPSRVAVIAVANNSPALLSALDLSVRFYWMGARAAASAEADVVKSQWIHVVEFLQWQLRRFDLTPVTRPDPVVRLAAERAARQALVRLGRAMFQQRDFKQFDALMRRTVDIRDI